MQNLTEKAKKNLSNYVGDDLFIHSFSGSGEHAYTMKIVNAHATDSKKVVLFPGWTATKAEFEALANKTVAGLIDGTIADTTIVGTPKPIASLLGFFRKNPGNVKKIHMLVTDALQFENSIEVLEGLSPFGDPASRYIKPADSKDPNQNNDKLVHIKDLEVQFNDQTALILDIIPGTTTLTFFFDKIFNSAAVLDGEIRKSKSMRDYQAMQ